MRLDNPIFTGVYLFMDEMDEQSCGDHLNSARDLSAFKAHILMAKSKAEAAIFLLWFDLSEADFVDSFPELAKKVQELPDDTSNSG